MTSNIGSQDILAAQQQQLPYEEMKKVAITDLRRHFRPEFLNRVDETVVFHPLSTAQLITIVDIQLTRLQSRLAERRITLDVTTQAKADLARRGYDPVYGARPLKRLIQQDLETPIGYALVQGELRDGDTAHVELKDGKIVVIPAVRTEVVS
jgi:ATP-dependent Clp protease ATP-binding subunit ClpB